jgi:membrane fusion protein (multidrug efflux system)
VQQSLGRQFVLVVGPGDTVRSHDVQPGAWSGEQWIIERGLEPGDRVVVDGVQKAAPGRAVRPVAVTDSTPARDSSSAAAGGARP